MDALMSLPEPKRDKIARRAREVVDGSIIELAAVKLVAEIMAEAAIAQADAVAAARREALEQAAAKVESMIYMLSIMAPGTGPFTRGDQASAETRDQAAAAIRAMKDETR